MSAARRLIAGRGLRGLVDGLVSVVLAVDLTRRGFSVLTFDYRDFGPARLAARGEARWTLPEAEFTYGEFEVQEVAYGV